MRHACRSSTATTPDFELIHRTAAPIFATSAAGLADDQAIGSLALAAPARLPHPADPAGRRPHLLALRRLARAGRLLPAVWPAADAHRRRRRPVPGGRRPGRGAIAAAIAELVAALHHPDQRGTPQPSMLVPPLGLIAAAARRADRPARGRRQRRPEPACGPLPAGHSSGPSGSGDSRSPVRLARARADGELRPRVVPPAVAAHRAGGPAWTSTRSTCAASSPSTRSPSLRHSA